MHRRDNWDIPKEDIFDHTWHIACWVLGLSSSDTERLRSPICTNENHSSDPENSRISQESAAVTKTLANPPNPPTKGASPTVQLANPIAFRASLSPPFTAAPTRMKTSIVTIFMDDNQYSVKQAQTTKRNLGQSVYLVLHMP